YERWAWGTGPAFPDNSRPGGACPARRGIPEGPGSASPERLTTAWSSLSIRHCRLTYRLPTPEDVGHPAEQPPYPTYLVPWSREGSGSSHSTAASRGRAIGDPDWSRWRRQDPNGAAGGSRTERSIPRWRLLRESGSD